VQNAIDLMNDYGQKKIPFLFIIDFEMKKPIIIQLADCEKLNVFYSINSVTNFPFQHTPKTEIFLTKNPISFAKYAIAFDTVQKHIHRGDSFLVNLTQPTPITLNLSLQEVFQYTKAKYQLYFKDQFVTFSPEIFVRINNNQIFSHPMKGTILASIPDAEKMILADKKEFAEHTTIVDLIRNDISKVAKKVWVERFRYIEKIKTHQTDILQVSSEIKGELENDWPTKIGDILSKLLPAGSISGAPKPETLRIIKEAEGYERGYYTGIFGIFDGKSIDSGVMIRFIENTNDGLIFKSGGGITSRSNAEAEYNEMIEKVYLPKQN
jgi:para-aminobenzoate synthetase component I